MRPRLIALLFEYPTLNGGERSMLAALNWLKQHDKRFEFVAITSSVGRLADALHEQQIPIHEWNSHDANGIRLSADQIESSLCRIISELKPQLLHANSLAMGRLSGRIAATLGIPTTTHLRDIMKLSPAAIADLNRNQKLIAVSEATRVFHVAQGVDASRVAVVRNGVDLTAFQPRIANGRLQAELKIADEIDGNDRRASGEKALIPAGTNRDEEASPPRRSVKLIATIGQIGLRKGQDVLASAASDVVARVPGAHFILIGERTSKKQESIDFEQAIDTKFALAGLSDHLHVLGYRVDVPELLNEVDLLVHPANQEPFGRVLLEATASGVPIVATDVGGTSEIVIHEETGLLVPFRDASALANAIVEILNDDAKSQSFRAAARDRALREFSIAIAAEKLGQVWIEVLTSLPRSAIVNPADR
jgi:glycosyltransferase involved in cell wall biosynthesis